MNIYFTYTIKEVTKTMNLKKIEGMKNTFTLELTESELEQEVWKYYKKTKVAKYEVSNFGRFRKNNKIMNITLNPSNGYLSCGSIKNNHRKYTANTITVRVFQNCIWILCVGAI